jgi:hypothetical protein
MIRAAYSRRVLPVVVLVLTCCLLSHVSGVEAMSSPAAHVVVAPALRKAEASPKASGFPGYWAQANCSYRDELATFFLVEDWSRGTDGIYNSDQSNIDTCLVVGGAITVRDEARVNDEPGTGPIEVYKAPAGSTIAGGVMTLRLRSLGGMVYVASPLNETTEDLITACSGCAAKTETVGIDRPGGTTMYVGAICTAAPGKTLCSTGEPDGVNAEIGVESATIVLHNEAKPAASGIAGTLLAKPVSGTGSLSFTATDKKGPGVYRVALAIDGNVVSSFTPDENELRCIPFGTYEGALVFESAQPCPQTTGVSVEVPTTSLSNGQHNLTVTVEDAAGNSSIVYSGTIEVSNPTDTAETPSNSPLQVAAPPVTIAPVERGTCNGTPCAEVAELTATPRQPKTLTRTQARSATTLTGRLTTPTGTPIKGAQLQLLQQVNESAAITPIVSTTTRPDGTWTLKAPAGPSRLLHVAYYSHTLDSIPAATLDYHENVQAVVSMHAPHRARLRHVIIFDGELAGGYVPASGESIQMEILYGGRWRTIEVLPTTSRGRWAYKYTFTLGAGTTYLFRAATVPNGAYPYTSAHSEPVRVTVER